MTSTPTPPAAAPPRRRTLGRVLTGVGVGLGALAIGWGAFALAGLLAARTVTTAHTYDAAPVVELVTDGAVTVTVGRSADAQVTATARYAWTRPDYLAQRHGDRLVVSHTCAWWADSVCDGALTVVVPRDTAVVVRSENGDITASGLAGTVDARSGNGDVTLHQIGSDVTARSSNGQVVVGDVGGDAQLSSDNGRVEASAVGGSLVATSSNGDLEVSTVGGSAVARTDNGWVQVAAVGGDVEATSNNGDVTVHGPGRPVALDISTDSGAQVVQAPTDPSASTRVTIRSDNGAVSYLGPDTVTVPDSPTWTSRSGTSGTRRARRCGAGSRTAPSSPGRAG